VDALLKGLCEEIEAYRAHSTWFDEDFHRATGYTWDNYITALRYKLDKLKQSLCNWDSYHVQCMKLSLGDYEAYLACGRLHKCTKEFPMSIE
jgi:hypothetical protein